MKNYFLLMGFSFLFAASGCAWQAEAMKVGPDTYETSANASPARGGYTGARELALESANEKCNELKKDIEVLDVQTQWGFPANGVVTVKFKCI